MRDLEVLSILQALRSWMVNIRSGGHEVLYVQRVVGDLCELPSDVARRLTELPVDELVAMPITPTDAAVKEMATQISTDAAIAQIDRAIGFYRGKAGLPPLDADGCSPSPKGEDEYHDA